MADVVNLEELVIKDKKVTYLRFKLEGHSGGRDGHYLVSVCSTEMEFYEPVPLSEQINTLNTLRLLGTYDRTEHVFAIYNREGEPTVQIVKPPVKGQDRTFGEILYSLHEYCQEVEKNLQL